MHRTKLAPGVEALQERLELQLGSTLYPVHRLDRATSGVLDFARDPETAGRLGTLFRERCGLCKTYLAIVRGWLPDTGEFDKPLQRLDKSLRRQVDASGRSAGADAPLLPALTRYRTMERVELPVRIGPHPSTRYSLVEVQPVTGRTHQIRRHFCSARHPLIGDTIYGEGRHNRYFREACGFHRLALHAWKLQVDLGPLEGGAIVGRPIESREEPLEFKAPLPAEWTRLFAAWGWGFSG